MKFWLLLNDNFCYGPLFWGAIPIFVDVEEDYYYVDANKIEQLITQKNTRNIGSEFIWSGLRLSKIGDCQRNLYVIEARPKHHSLKLHMA